MAQKNETPVLILSLLITLGLIGGGWWFFNKNKPLVTNDSQPSIETSNRPSSQNNTIAIESLISTGNRILIAEDSNDLKKAAVLAIAT
jgi:branched-chain amino acid transport system substrate-binding protein